MIDVLTAKKKEHNEKCWCPLEPFWLFIYRNVHIYQRCKILNLYDIFSDLHGKDSKTLICNIS